MPPERTSCVGSHPCQGYRRTSCNGWDWILLSTGSLKFRQLEIDGANGEHTAAGNDFFQDWLDDLRDLRARIAILRRFDRVARGNFGDHRFCREGACGNYGLMSVRATGSTTHGQSRQLCCYCAGVTSGPKMRILPVPLPAGRIINGDTMKTPRHRSHDEATINS